MGYKVKGAVKRYRKKIMAAVILWAILTIVFVCPMGVAIKNYKDAGGGITGGATTKVLFQSIGKAVENPLSSFGTSLTPDYIGTTFKVFGIFTLFYALLILIGVLKGMPKNEYEDIEHGSSDWSENGEQYTILSPNKGIILAEKNYLPVDKRGNVNVLIVRRFRFSENLQHMLYLMHINA